MTAILGLYFEFILLSSLPSRIWGFAIGISIFCVFTDNSLLAGQEPVIRVLIKDSKKFRFRADSSFPLLVTGIGYGEKKLSSLNLKVENGQMHWSAGSASSPWQAMAFDKKIIVRSLDPRGIWLGKRRYRGDLRVRLKDKRLLAVNHLGIERYLFSVVGSEMPKEWPKAALKAQAIAARTYALKRLGKKPVFDINSTESTQVYLGMESETESTRKAVNSTRSLVLSYKGQLISAVFHSSSGGQTEASGSVWKYQLPYLISVRDYDQNSPKYQWEMTFSPEELKRIFFEVGSFQNIRIIETSKTGRILRAQVSGIKGNLSLSGKELRNRMNLKSTRAKFKFISYRINPKKNMKLSLENNSINRSSTFPLTSTNYLLSVKGFGFGHGVGMSQWGAHELAKRGSNYRQILRYYYRGIQIRPY